MKAIKWVLIGLLGLVILAFIVVGILLLAIDRGEYKQEIIEQVETHTGRALTIGGNLDISLFPWIGISISELSIANAQGFGDDPFVQAKAANVKIELLPLLRRELRVDTIQLVGVALDLQRNSQGTNNWDDLTKSGGNSTGNTSSSTPSAENSPLAALAIGGVEISDSKVRWRDQQQGTDAMLQQFNLSIGQVKLHESFPLSLSFTFNEVSSALSAEMRVTSDVTIDIQQQKYQLAALAFNAEVRGASLPESGVLTTLSANVLADLVQQTVVVSGLDSSLAGIPVTGEVLVERLNTSPGVSGKLNVSKVDIASLMQQFAIEIPETASSDVLKSADAQLAFAADPKALSVDILAAHIDTTSLQGKLNVALGKIPDIRFSLSIDSINLDHYLPPPAATPVATNEASAAKDTADLPIGLPLAVLKAQNLTGKVSVDQLTAANIRMSEVQVPLSVRDGVATLNDLSAKLYQGTVDVNARIDASGSQTRPPSMSAKANLFGVQIGPLLDDLQGDGVLSGAGDVRLDLSTRGETPRALKAALNGDVAMNLRDGAIDGINIAQSLRNAKARLTGQTVADDDAPLSTDFSQLSVSGKIKKGVLHSDDLDMRSPLLRVSGKGGVDLNREYVDYKVRVLVTDDKTGQGGKSYAELAGLKLSVPIRGYFDDLGSDFSGAVLAAIKQNAKDEINEKLDKIKAEQEQAVKAKIEEKKEEVKEKAKDKLKNKLKSLFD